MASRLPASRQTREELKALIEGRLSTASAKDELVKLATRLIVEEALEGEAGDALVRRPSLLNDARAVAQGDLCARPALHGGREGRSGEEPVVHAGEVFVEVRAGGVIPTVDRMGMVGHSVPS